jgi:hypothetical protein
MIVERRTFLAKQWQEHKLAGVLEQMMERLGEQGPFQYRVYTFYVAPINTVVLEIEVEDLQQWQEGWKYALSDPDMVEYMKQSTELTERGGTSELWHLHAQG